MAFRRQGAKVVFIGNAYVGKTSIVLRHNGSGFSTDQTMTLGANFIFSTVHPVLRERVRMQIWDTAGMERFRSMVPLYIRGAHAVVLVFDVSDRKSFADLTLWIREIERTMLLSDLVVVVIGNKTDLFEERQVHREEAETFATSNGFKYAETSAKMDEGIAEAVHLVAAEIYDRFSAPAKQSESSTAPDKPGTISSHRSSSVSNSDNRILVGITKETSKWWKCKSC